MQMIYQDAALFYLESPWESQVETNFFWKSYVKSFISTHTFYTFDKNRNSTCFRPFGHVWPWMTFVDLETFAHVWPWMTFVDLETNFVEKISSRAPFWGIIRDIVWDFGQKFNFNIFSWKLAQLCKKTCFIWIRFDRNSSTGHYR